MKNFICIYNFFQKPIQKFNRFTRCIFLSAILMGISPGISYAASSNAPVAKNITRAAKIFREYSAPTTSSEKEDIRYVVNTLGMASLVKIAKNKSSIKKAGDRVDHVHPLQFLIVIFTDEKTKASFHAVQSRGWIWGEFSDNLTNSLKGESERNNITIAMLNDFARKVEIDPSFIYEAAEKGQWYEFIKILTDKIPRKTPNDRYDI